MKVIYMGTPAFALAPLEKLCAAHTVLGVVTQPDKVNKRGKKVAVSPVKAYALSRGIPVMQPERASGEESEQALRELGADVIVVCAYGQILKPNVLTLTRYGCINIHASLLPCWRGAAPIQRAMMAGETRLGVTIMQMDEGMDTGDMLFKGEITRGEDETFSSVAKRLSRLGADLIVETLDTLQKEGKLKGEKQQDQLATYAPKITKEDRRIDFSLPCRAVKDKILALSEEPGAVFMRGTEAYQAIDAVIREDLVGDAGHVLISSEADGLVVGCGRGAVEITTLKAPSKRAMQTREYLRGHRIYVGEQFK